MCGISISFPRNLFKKNQMLEVCSRGMSVNELIKEDFFMMHQLLSTTRSDDYANIQPCEIDDQKFLLFNGLITNTQKLANKYSITDFDGDTELLVKCIQKVGLSIFHELQGSFVICVVDIKKKKIIVYRDFSDCKPLYYYFDHCKIKLHSDPRSIVGRDLSKTEIVSRSYQLFGFVPEQLFYSSNDLMLRCFKPGVITTLSLNDDGWSVSEDQSVVLFSHLDNMEQLLEDVVNSFSIGVEVLPSAVFLSGGTDSSLISYFLRKRSIKSITVASHATDEISRAKQWSDRLSLKNFSVFYSKEEIKEVIKNKETLLPFQSKDGSNILAATLLAKKINTRISFSGAGLDEVTNGYKQLRKVFLVNKMFSSSLMRFISQILGYSFAKKKYFKMDDQNVLSYLISRLWFKKARLNDNDLRVFTLLSKELVLEVDRWEKSFSSMSQQDMTLLYDYIFYTRNQLMREADVLGYANNIEIRVPFCEPNFVLSMLKKTLRSKRSLKTFLIKKGWKDAPKEGFFFE